MTTLEQALAAAIRKLAEYGFVGIDGNAMLAAITAYEKALQSHDTAQEAGADKQ